MYIIKKHIISTNANNLQNKHLIECKDMIFLIQLKDKWQVEQNKCLEMEFTYALNVFIVNNKENKKGLLPLWELWLFNSN